MREEKCNVAGYCGHHRAGAPAADDCGPEHPAPPTAREMAVLYAFEGDLLEERRDSSRGSEQYPLSRDEHRQKFRLNASRALGADQVTRLDAAVVALVGGTGSVADALALTRA